VRRRLGERTGVGIRRERCSLIDIANYNRGLWVSEAITFMAVTDGLEDRSVRHGLKEGGESPFSVAHMAGNAAEWVAD
jgi:formylglycine-generating enzyme